MTVRMAFDRASSAAALNANAKLAKDAMYQREDFLRSTDSTQTVAGTGTFVTTAAEQGHPGVGVSQVTAVATPDRVALSPATSQVAQILCGGGEVAFEHVSKTSDAQDAVDRWSDRCGIGDVVGTADMVDGVYFEADTATHGDNNVRLCTASNSVRTKTSLGIVYTPATWERWGFIVNALGTSVQAYRNGVAVGVPVTTNIPTFAARLAGVYVSQVIKTLGANARSVSRDYMETSQVFSTSR